MKNDKHTSFKSLKIKFKDTNNIQQNSKAKEDTKGKLFLKLYGITLSLYKAMRKAGIDFITDPKYDIYSSLYTYKEIRSNKKKEVKKLQQKKHADSVLVKKASRNSGKSKIEKGKNKLDKVKEIKK